jgi:hypothetical protein
VQPAWACDCSYFSPSDAYEHADIIFSGYVTKISPGRQSQSVTFQVADSWKGVTTNEVTLESVGISSSCGFTFIQNHQYLVYGQEQNGIITTGLCTRTKALDRGRAQEDFAYLTWVKVTHGLWDKFLDIIWIGLGGSIIFVFAIVYFHYRRRKKAVDTSNN